PPSAPQARRSSRPWPWSYFALADRPQEGPFSQPLLVPRSGRPASRQAVRPTALGTPVPTVSVSLMPVANCVPKMKAPRETRSALLPMCPNARAWCSGRLLVVLHFLEVGVDDIVVGRLGATRSLGFRFGLAGLVHRFAELHGGLRQGVGLFLDRLGVLALEHALQVGKRRLDRGLLVGTDLVAVILERLLGRMDEALGLVLGLDGLTLGLVRRGVRLGFLDHAVDVGIAETTRGLDADLLLLAGALVLGRDVDDAVGVDVERHLDLRHAARRRRNAGEIEIAEQLVVGCHLALAMEDADGHRVLVVLGGREDLALFGRDRGVAIDQAGEHATQRLDAEA